MWRCTTRQRTMSAASTPRRTRRHSSPSHPESDSRCWTGAAPASRWCCSRGQGTTRMSSTSSRSSSPTASTSSASRAEGSDGRVSPRAATTSTRVQRDDIAVLDTLGVRQAVFVGHSIAGMELNKLAAAYPQRVAKLVYLDALDIGSGGWSKLAQPPAAPDFTARDLVSVQRVAAASARDDGYRKPLAAYCNMVRRDATGRVVGPVTPPAISAKLLAGLQPSDYARIHAPALGIFNRITPPYRAPYYWSLKPAVQEQWDGSIAAFGEVDRRRHRALPHRSEGLACRRDPEHEPLRLRRGRSAGRAGNAQLPAGQVSDPTPPGPRPPLPLGYRQGLDHGDHRDARLHARIPPFLELRGERHVDEEVVRRVGRGARRFSRRRGGVYTARP